MALTYCAIIWYLSRMAQQSHAVSLKIPQHGCVVEKALPGNGLSIPAKFDVTKAVICSGSMQLCPQSLGIDDKLRPYACRCKLECCATYEQLSVSFCKWCSSICCREDKMTCSGAVLANAQSTKRSRSLYARCVLGNVLLQLSHAIPHTMQCTEQRTCLPFSCKLNGP